MKLKLHSLLLVLVILIGSVVTLNAQVKTDYDHSVAFSSYKTYTWLKVQGGDSLWDDRIRTAVDSQLWRKRVEYGGFGRRCIDLRVPIDQATANA
jgi:hypothetical protein